MMILFFGSLIAGMLTVLAPCVLPLLPIIIGGSLSGESKDRKRIWLIIASLGTSLFVFTLLLKATSLLINVPQRTYAYVSGAIIILLGLVTLLPSLYLKIIAKLGIETRAQASLNSSTGRGGNVGPLLIGASLGPIFSSCSPVYAYILASILPVSFGRALVYILAYITGLVAVLLPIAYYGRRFVARIKFAAKPDGWFQRTVAVVFIATGLLLISGYDKRFQVWIANHTPFSTDKISSSFLPTSHPTEDSDLFNVNFPAPELVGLDNWVNSPPLQLKDLRGKVVLVDFWTYSCINCIRNNPHLEKWYQTYKDKGFVVIGVHAPEFAFEKVLANVEKGVRDQKISYPVGLDNELKTWSAYQNRSWPAGYLIDAEGVVRRLHEGEGEYAEEEQAIRQLLTDNSADLSSVAAAEGADRIPFSYGQTPETYLGYDRAENYVGEGQLSASNQVFKQAALRLNQWTLDGRWQVQGQQIIAAGDSVIKLRFAAKNVYLVMGSAQPERIFVRLDGAPIGQSGGKDVIDSELTVTDNRLYELVNLDDFSADKTLELHVPNGVQLNAFTFGS